STDLRKAASHSGLRVAAIDRAQVLGVRVVRYVRRRAAWQVKRVLRWLARRTYFPARKRLSRLGQRVHAAYVNWELEPHITTPGPLRTAPTARIVMCHASNRINAARLTVCDYSRITLINEQAEIVAGADVLIARFCTFNVLGRVV